MQPKKPGPYGPGKDNFKCEKSSESLYVTKVSYTTDTKCFTVFKVDCDQTYTTGKVRPLRTPHAPPNDAPGGALTGGLEMLGTLCSCSFRLLLKAFVDLLNALRVDAYPAFNLLRFPGFWLFQMAMLVRNSMTSGSHCSPVGTGVLDLLLVLPCPSLSSSSSCCSRRLRWGGPC